MRTLSRWGLLLLALVLAAGVGRAADEKPAGPPDRKALDEALYNNLRDVINRGAALYNSGDQAGCYRLFEGALMAVRPLLGHHPALQKTVTDALNGAEQDPMLNRRAFMLRSALDQVRNELNPRGKAPAGAPPAGGGGAPAGGPPPAGGGTARADTAWARMGGERGVRKIVNDLADAVTKDPKVDFSRGGKYNPTPAEVAHMKQMIVEQISSATGGPLAYEGKSMVDIHKDMGITNAQFDAFVEDFRGALRKNNVDAKDAADLVGKVEATRKEIVRPRPAPGAGGEKTKPKAAAGARLTGKIVFDGKPLPGGEVAVYDRAGKATKGAVKADGSYEVKDLQPGTYKMAVKTDDKDVKIPKEFGDPQTSGVTLDVKAGDNTHDIVLKK